MVSAKAESVTCGAEAVTQRSRGGGLRDRGGRWARSRGRRSDRRDRGAAAGAEVVADRADARLETRLHSMRAYRTRGVTLRHLSSRIGRPDDPGV